MYIIACIFLIFKKIVKKIFRIENKFIKRDNSIFENFVKTYKIFLVVFIDFDFKANKVFYLFNVDFVLEHINVIIEITTY